MCKFTTASIEERRLMTILFERFNVKNYEFSDETSFDREDGFYTGRTDQYVFEVKNRDVSSTQYDTTIIEKDKVDYLVKEAKRLNKKAVIFFFFNDNTWMSQEVDIEAHYSTISLLAPKTTMGDKEMVYKDCIPFLITKLKKINYEI